MNRPPRGSVPSSWLRIVGGTLRSQRVRYGGQGGLRPMKERVREALFNIIAHDVPGTVALDLFAGTGVLGFEAVSRGSTRAVLIEADRSHARQLLENVERLRIDQQVSVVVGDAFQHTRWLAQMPGPDEKSPWLVFCCPPYHFYQDRATELVELLGTVCQHAPLGSTFVVEAEVGADLNWLPTSVSWTLRPYPPALLAIGRPQS